MKFLAVKVDRDERPDVDARYQSAISAISGQVVALTGFLMPDGKRFLGDVFSTGGSVWAAGFRRVLLAVAESVQDQEADLFAGGGIAGGFGWRRRKCSRRARKVRCGSGGVAGAVYYALLTLRMRIWKAPKFPHCSAMTWFWNGISKRKSGIC